MIDQKLSQRVEEYIASRRENIIQDWKALVSIPSVSHRGVDNLPFGPECTKVLQTALDLAAAKGLKGHNHDNWYGTIHWGQGDKTIGIFSHLDVVPEGNNWQYAPYAPVEKDGYLIGRGVADNKNAAIAGLYVMECLSALGINLQSQISLFLGLSEETGMEDIEKYVAEQPMPDFSIVPDTKFPVCHGEKGILHAHATANQPFETIREFVGGLVGNMVADRATARLKSIPGLLEALITLAKNNSRIQIEQLGEDILVTASGVAAHASMPEGSVNAIYILAQFLALCPLLPQQDLNTLAFVAQALSDNYGKTIGIACSDQPSGALTCISGVAQTQNGCLTLRLDVRYPVTIQGDTITAKLFSFFKAGNWTFKVDQDSAPTYISADDPKVVELCRIYHQVTGKDATPYVMGGGTYSRHLKNAIGFGMEEGTPDGFPSGHGSIHQPDEAMSIQGLLDAIKIYVLSIIEIDKLLHC